MKEDICSGIYKIKNIKTNKVYIGQTHNFKKRYLDHVSALKRNKHDNNYLQKAWNKYTEEDFSFSILEYCDNSELPEREQYWMDYHKCYDSCFGYNLNPSSTKNPMLGKTHTLEARAKISAKAKGRKLSKEHFEAILKANTKVPKPDKNLPKKESRSIDESKIKKVMYEYHIFKPDGEHIVTTNLTGFCDINRCSHAHLRSLIFNNTFYRGWFGIAIPLKPKTNTLSPKLKLLTIQKTNYKYA